MIHDFLPNCHGFCRLFGGLVADIRRKAPWYLSDFRDGLHIQCLASAFFMYFGCLVPMVMFGGLLGIVTENNIVSLLFVILNLLSTSLMLITVHQRPSINDVALCDYALCDGF